MEDGYFEFLDPKDKSKPPIIMSKTNTCPFISRLVSMKVLIVIDIRLIKRSKTHCETQSSVFFFREYDMWESALKTPKKWLCNLSHNDGPAQASKKTRAYRHRVNRVHIVTKWTSLLSRFLERQSRERSHRVKETKMRLTPWLRGTSRIARNSCRWCEGDSCVKGYESRDGNPHYSLHP